MAIFERQPVVPRVSDANAAARSELRSTAMAWFVVAAIGQCLFAYHIAEAYIGTALAGNFAAGNKRLFVGLVAGNFAGNLALVAHLFIAFVITLGGPLQLIAPIRTHVPPQEREDLHRGLFRLLSAAARRARTPSSRQAQPERLRQGGHSRFGARRDRGDRDGRPPRSSEDVAEVAARSTGRREKLGNPRWCAVCSWWRLAVVGGQAGPAPTQYRESADLGGQVGGSHVEEPKGMLS